MHVFRNPVSPFDAPDPLMMYDPVTKYYYSLFTRGSKLELFRSRHASSIVTDGDSRIIYEPNGERDGIWAIFGLLKCTEVRTADGTFIQADS